MAIDFIDPAKLHASIARWVADDTHQGFYTTDQELHILVWNRWMEIRSGRSAAEVVGKSLIEVFPDTRERGIVEYYQSALNGHVTFLSHGLHRFVLAMPPTKVEAGFPQMPQSGRIGPLNGSDGVVGTVTTIEDVSDRLAAEAELRKQIEAQQLARATAEKALRAKDDFLSTLSHEMRTPLNAVLGWTRILLMRGDVEKDLLERALQVIERNASAQAKMIDDMLDMARIVAGKLRIEMQPVDLVGIVLAAVDVVMPSANAKRIALRTSLDPRTPQVLGDPDRLQQVIWNLLSNALKFTSPGGWVEVRLEPDGKHVRLVVRDSGQGIAAEFLPYVFERFRQADVSSGRRHGGLGLGLALVRDLVEMHGGTVRVDSEGEGKGSSFTIEIPGIVSPEARRWPSRPEGADHTAQRLSNVRVLLVEDETDSRDLTQTALSQCGAIVSPAASSTDAIARLMQAPADELPHVIVTDIGMPSEDGFELLRRIRGLDDSRSRIPAIALTGYATADDVKRVLAAGFQRHVAKPVDPSALVTAVADIVRSV